MHLLHHLLHLLELVQQPVHFLHRHPGAGRDAALARGLDDLRPAALAMGHGIDDALEPPDLALIHLGGLRRLCQLRRQFVQHGRHAAHLAHLRHLLLEVLEIETLALAHLVGQLAGLIDIDRLVRLFHQRQHIAHAKNARSHAIGMKQLQAVELLAHAGELDRTAGDLTHRQRGATAGIAIELGQHHAGERQRLAEGARHIHRVLTLHRVNHKQGFGRMQRAMQFGDLAHHGLIDRQPSGGIDNQHIVIVGAGILQRRQCNVQGLGAGLGRKKRRAGLCRHGFELLDGRRPIDVTRHQQGLAPFALNEPLGQLAAGGGFARALQTGHQYHCRRGYRQVQTCGLAAHQCSEFALHHADQRLTGREAAHHILTERLFLHLGDEIAHHRQRHISLEQGNAHLAQGVLNIVFGQTRLTAQGLDDARQALGQVVEHGKFRASLMSEPRVTLAPMRSAFGHSILPCDPRSALAFGAVPVQVFVDTEKKISNIQS